MKYEINFKNRPLGHVHKAKAAGETHVEVISNQFSTTEDGQSFIKLLEGFPDEVLGLVTAQHDVRVHPAEIKTMLVIVNADKSATAYINEGVGAITMRSTGPIEKGQVVYKDDIADVESVKLEMTISPDAGVIFVFSSGWRRGYFYDFMPILPDGPVQRQYDCEVLFGQFFGYIFFQERFSINEAEWQALFAARVFPFAGLKNETIDQILSHVREGWDLIDLNAQIVAEVKEKATRFLDSWKKHHVLGGHTEFLERAVERFMADDYVSCSSILMPQIEGVLRSNQHLLGNAATRPIRLAESAVSSKIGNERCLLLPEHFRRYLSEVYFADFPHASKPGEPQLPISRNTVAHGLAPGDGLNAFASAVCLLTLHQLFYFVEQMPPSAST